MEWLTLLKNILYVIIVLSTCAPAIVAYVKTRGKRKKAEVALEEAISEKDKAEAEAAKEKADAELMQIARNFIASMETTLDGFDKIMKAQGSSAGLMKKDLVFIKLQAYALQHNYAFDANVWSDIIDDLVGFTKSVNTKK